MQTIYDSTLLPLLDTFIATQMNISMLEVVVTLQNDRKPMALANIEKANEFAKKNKFTQKVSISRSTKHNKTQDLSAELGLLVLGSAF